MQELQRHTSILKKVRAKVVQFLRIFLFYVLKFYFYLLKLIIKYEACTLNIVQYTYLYAAYADNTTFFLKNRNSVRQLMQTFSTFSWYSCLKLNCKKCDIAGIGVLKSVKVADCGMKVVNLITDTIIIAREGDPR